jgi:hypothetical protein
MRYRVQNKDKCSGSGCPGSKTFRLPRSRPIVLHYPDLDPNPTVPMYVKNIEIFLSQNCILAISTLSGRKSSFSTFEQS